MKTDKIIYKHPDSGVIMINWPLIPRMSYLKPQTLDGARQTARSDNTYATRREGEIPAEVQKLINDPDMRII